MDVLAHDLKQLTLGCGVGSFATRTQRHRGLQLIARELRALGHALPSARSIKPKHIEKLVAKWKADGLAIGTIKNRMSWVRFWTAGVRKTSVLSKSNAEVGIERRTAFKGDKARTTTGAQLAKLDERMQLVVRLQMAFGMRLEESILFRPDVADQGDCLTMQASWCKGGRARTIPVLHPRQRELLDEVSSVVGQGSLIPDGMSKIGYRKQLERKTWSAGIRNLHGHRHWYAQWRYRTLTGRPCPAAGGETYERMNRGDRAGDWRARKTISAELGHGRMDVTDTYLGRRFAARAAR